MEKPIVTVNVSQISAVSFITLLSDNDVYTAMRMLGLKSIDGVIPDDDYNKVRNRLFEPDVTIYQKDGITPYLHRWYIIPRNDHANVYLHIQVNNDEHEEGAHDHRADSQSTVLGGGYIDTAFTVQAGELKEWTKILYEAGSVIVRKAATPHYLSLAPGHDYAMTLFCTGPAYRKWGYYDPDGTFKLANEDYVKTGVASSALQTKS